MFSPCVFVYVCVSVCLCLSRCLSGKFNYEGLVPHKWYFAGIFLGIITRDSEVMMFSPRVFVCVCVSVCLCLSWCLSGRFNYEGLVPRKLYFAGILLGMPNCASYVSRTRDVKISEMLMAIFLIYIQLPVSIPVKKFVASSKWRPFWIFLNMTHSFNLTSDMKRSSKSMQKSIFHDDDVIDDVTGWSQSRPSLFLYKLNNDFFMTTKNWTKISSLKFLCIGIMQLWLHLNKCVFMTLLVTSPGHKVGQILKLIYLRQYLSVDQKLKMSEMPMAIFLVYSTSGITFGKKKFVASSKWRPFWKILNIKHSFNLTSDMKRSSKIMQKRYFAWWWRHQWRHRMTSNSALFIPL